MAIDLTKQFFAVQVAVGLVSSRYLVYLDWPTETGSADGRCIMTICSDDDDTVDELAESRKEAEEGPTTKSCCCCCCWAAARAAMAAAADDDAAALKGARTMVWREEGAVDTSEQVSLTREGSLW